MAYGLTSSAVIIPVSSFSEKCLLNCFSQRGDVEVDLEFSSFPFTMTDRGPIVMHTVSFCPDFFKEAPVKLEFGVFLTQICEEALVIAALDAIKAQKCIGKLVECIIMHSEDHCPIDRIWWCDWDEFSRLSQNRQPNIYHGLYPFPVGLGLVLVEAVVLAGLEDFFACSIPWHSFSPVVAHRFCPL